MGIFHFLLGTKSKLRTQSHNEGSNACMPVSNDLSDKPKLIKRTITVSEKMLRLTGSSQDLQDTVKSLNVAAQLMRSGEFELCIEAYKNIAKKNPDKKERCHLQIGAALYYLGRYEDAMCYYNKPPIEEKDTAHRKNIAVQRKENTPLKSTL